MQQLENQRRLFVLRSLVVVLSVFGAQAGHALDLPSSQKLAAELGIKEQQFDDLDKGKVVSFDLAEKSDKELSAGVVMYLPGSPKTIIDILTKGKLDAIENDIVQSFEIPAQASLEDFKKFGFNQRQQEEAKKFLQTEVSDRFNLSDADRQIIASTTTNGANLREAAADAYRKILFTRLQDYRTNGLKGIAPYSRKDRIADPADELRINAENSKVVAKYFPALYQGWLNYPHGMPPEAEQSFQWLNLMVEDRPTPVLTHRVLQSRPEGEVILARQFYVGHSYNSSQLTVGCLPYREGSLVFYAERSSTDQVAGLGSRLKHRIGREHLRDEMIQRLNKLRTLL